VPYLSIDASPAEALEVARLAAGGLDVRIGGGPSTIRQFLAADLIDHMHIAIVPIVLGRGERLWDGLEELESIAPRNCQGCAPLDTRLAQARLPKQPRITQRGDVTGWVGLGSALYQQPHCTTDQNPTHPKRVRFRARGRKPALDRS
jgi:hypothetical protein